jgi:hypothetical protein
LVGREREQLVEPPSLASAFQLDARLLADPLVALSRSAAWGPGERHLDLGEGFQRHDLSRFQLASLKP